METLIQSASRTSEREYLNQQGLKGPFEGQIVEVIGREDAVGVSYGPTQNRRMPIQHPFVGAGSWIRSAPDVGSRVLMQNRYDTGQAEILKTLPIGPFERANSYFNQQSTYRELNPGEHDIAALGFGSIYLNRRGGIDQFSGTGISRQTSQDQLDIRDQAPTQIKQLLNWSPGELGDEFRLGIVKRWETAVEEKYVQQEENFLSEHYLKMLNPSGQQPAVLLERTEGHVVDDAGAFIKQFSTQNNLRHRTVLYTDTDEQHIYEIDVQGNALEIFPSVATIGKETRIPNGSYIAQIGVDRDMTIQRDEKVIVGQNIQYTVGRSVNYQITNDLTVEAAEGQNVLSMLSPEGSQSVMLRTGGFGLRATQAGGGTTEITGPQGSNLTMNSQGFVEISDGVGAGITLEGQNASLFSTALLEIMSQTVSLNAQTVLLGANAVIPALLGLTTLNWNDTHTHTTGAPGSPTSPPIIPSASLIGTPLSLMSTTAFISPNI